MVMETVIVGFGKRLPRNVVYPAGNCVLKCALILLKIKRFIFFKNNLLFTLGIILVYSVLLRLKTISN